jgi:hypothetical protein
MPVITLHLEKGWLPDIPPYELPEGGLSDTDLIFPSMLGYRGIDQATAVDTSVSNSSDGATGARQFSDAGVAYWGSIHALHKITNTTPANITNDSRTKYYAPWTSGMYMPSARWQFEKYGGWIIATNGYDPVQIIKDANADDLGRASADVDDMPPAARYCLIYGGRLILGDLCLAMARSNEDDTMVASSWFQYKISGLYYTKTATHTDLAAGTIPTDKWGIYRFTIQTDGTITSTAGAANFTTGYATEAAAITALPAVPGGEEEMGYVTVCTKASNDFVGGTDALFGGSSGDVASATNYYIDTGIRSRKMLYWSGLEDVEDWVVSTTTGCDRQDMPELRGVITGLHPIQGGFAVLASDSIRLGWLSRGADVFNFTNANSDIGALAYTSVPANGGVYFWSERDMHFFDGQRVHFLGEGIRLTIRGGIGYATTVVPGTYHTQAMSVTPVWSVAHHPEEQLIAWNYTYGNASPGSSLLFIYSYKLNQFTRYKQYTYSTDATEVHNVYFSPQYNCFCLLRNDNGTSSVEWYRINTTGTNGDLTTRELSVRDDKGEMQTITIKRVRPRIHGYSATITVTVSSRMNEDDTPTTETGTLETAKFSGWADVISNPGRYHKIKTTLSGGVCRSIDVEYEVRGKQ